MSSLQSNTHSVRVPTRASSGAPTRSSARPPTSASSGAPAGAPTRASSGAPAGAPTRASSGAPAGAPTKASAAPTRAADAPVTAGADALAADGPSKGPFLHFLQGKKKVVLDNTEDNTEENKEEQKGSNEVKDEKNDQDTTKYELLWQILAFHPLCQDMCSGRFYSIPDYFPWDLNENNKSEHATWQNLNTIMTNIAYAFEPRMNTSEDDKNKSSTASSSSLSSTPPPPAPPSSPPLPSSPSSLLNLSSSSPFASAIASSSSSSTTLTSASAATASPSSETKLQTLGLQLINSIIEKLTSASSDSGDKSQSLKCFVYSKESAPSASKASAAASPAASLAPSAAASPAASPATSPAPSPPVSSPPLSSRSELLPQDVETLEKMTSCSEIQANLPNITLSNEVSEEVEKFFSENYDHIYPLFACRNTLEDFAQKFLQNILNFTLSPLQGQLGDFGAQDEKATAQQNEQATEQEENTLDEIQAWMFKPARDYKPYKFYNFQVEPEKESQELKDKIKRWEKKFLSKLGLYPENVTTALDGIMRQPFFRDVYTPKEKYLFIWIVRLYLRESLLLIITFMLGIVCKSHWKAITQPSNSKALYQVRLSPYVQACFNSEEDLEEFEGLEQYVMKTVQFINDIKDEKKLGDFLQTKGLLYTEIFVGNQRKQFLKDYSEHFSVAKDILESGLKTIRDKQSTLFNILVDSIRRRRRK